MQPDAVRGSVQRRHWLAVRLSCRTSLAELSGVRKVRGAGGAGPMDVGWGRDVIEGGKCEGERRETETPGKWERGSWGWVGLGCVGCACVCTVHGRSAVRVRACARWVRAGPRPGAESLGCAGHGPSPVVIVTGCEVSAWGVRPDPEPAYLVRRTS
ncbi:hypothetical protein chiPu_0014640 [Chiloscyllium punctatum]|uniref:Uncharacterized protein n=1 Tax=Chiloscyllium punctatum TaxID=137246 RepID=A0A401T0J7_CHIPU|nr:hypothetical protein [Chiloscyllium punctatum]